MAISDDNPMVNRIIRFIHQEIAGIHQAALILGIFTLLSQVLALIRNRMFANTFGAGDKLDVYYAAFLVPDFLYATVASLVSISVLIPFFSGIIDKEESKKEMQALMNSIFTIFLVVMVVVCVIAWILMPYISKIILSGIHDQSVLDLQIQLSRIILLQPIFLGISNLLGVITQISKRFFIYSLSPILYNISIMLGLVLLYPYFGMTGIAIGVALGGILHFAVQIPFVASRGFLPRPTLSVDWKAIKKILSLSIPRTIALSASSLELIFITGFASLITSGSIAIFNLANNLQSVPFAIVSTSYALAAFPTLSAYFEKGEKSEFVRHLTIAARHIIFWSIPISMLFIVLRAQIVRTLLGSGNFNWDDTRLTAACLAMFSVSLVAQGLELIFIRAYYAAGQTKKPLFINIWSSVITVGAPFLLLMLFNHSLEFRAFFESLFKIMDIPGSAVLMLPLGFSLGSIVNAIIFWICFEREFGTFSKEVLPTLYSSLQAGIIGGFVAYMGLNTFDTTFNINTLQGIFMQGFIAGIMGIAATIVIFKLLKNREIDEVWATFHHKIWGDKVVVSDLSKIEH